MINFVVKKYMSIFCLALLIIAVGVMAYITIPREANPEIKAPYIFVVTSYPGVSAVDIESLITQPLEGELKSIPGLKTVSSTTRAGVSSIVLEFNPKVTMETALQKTREKTDDIKSTLPEDAMDPYIKEFSSSDWPIGVFALTHPDGIRAIDQTARDLQNKLEKISGVLEARITGVLNKEIAIELDPAKLSYYGFSLQDVQQAIQSEHMTIPGGTLKEESRNYSLSITGEITNPDEFSSIMVKSGSKSIPLNKLGDVSFKPTETEALSRVNGMPAINIEVTKRIGGNSAQIMEQVNQLLNDSLTLLPEGAAISTIYDESVEIKTMVRELENNMISGFILVILITLFFLGKTNSIFVSLAIPFSMLLSFFILQLLGITLNTIVLFSLILALGMLVDNGIVIVENIFRHGGMGKDRKTAAIDGTKEVAGPIIASTVTTCLAFAPILFMPGFMGQFLSYLPKTVIVVLSSSLFVALFLNPVFCSRFLRISEKARRKMTEGSGLFQKVQQAYSRLLKLLTRYSWVTITVSVLFVITGFALFISSTKEMLFFPEQDPYSASISIKTPSGTPLHMTDEIISRIESRIPETDSAADNVTAVSGSGGSNKGNITVYYKPFEERDITGSESTENIKNALENITGGEIIVEEASGGIDSGSDISYRIIGLDYGKMGEINSEIETILKKYPELKNISSDFEASEPEYGIQVDREKAAYFGLSTSQIAMAVRNHVNGISAGKFRQDNDEYDIQVRYDNSYRFSLNNLRSITITTYQGDEIPLSSVAEIAPKNTLGVIKRKDLKRNIEISANFFPEILNKTEIAEQIAEEIEALKQNLPGGYEIALGAGAESRDESQTFLFQAFIIALFLIFIVLIAQFNSLSDPMIIMISVFLSLGGVMWGFFISGMPFVIMMCGVGCFALAGVAVNNCIVLVDYTNILIHKKKMPWREAIIEAGRTRLRPVLLTAITTILALIPMAFSVSLDIFSLSIQTESMTAVFWEAFSWTMIYGLSFATFMTLIIVPALLHTKYSIRERKEKRKLLKQAFPKTAKDSITA